MNRVMQLIVVVLVLFLGTRQAFASPTKAECIAASESGQDLRKTDKLIEARSKFTQCAADGCPIAVREDCARHLDELSRLTPSIVFDARDSSGNVIRGITIVLDGQQVDPTSSVELDPGEHTVTFSAYGWTPVAKRFAVVVADRLRHEAIRLDRVAPIPYLMPTPRETTSLRPPSPLAWTAFGTGGAGLLTGIVAGVVAGNKHGILAGECGVSCPPAYASDLDAFHAWRTISTIGYIAGAIGVATGITIWIASPTSSKTRVAIGLSSAELETKF